MPGFDWNKNGKKDNFDRYMDMKVMSSVSDDANSNNFDVDDEFDEDSEEEIYDEINLDIDNVEIQNIPGNNSNEQQINSFQDELKKNMKSPEVVQKEKYDIDKNYARCQAERTLKKIKEYLLYRVQHGEYEQEEGVTFVSCTCDINQHFLRSQWYNNTAEIKKDKETFFLFRDPNLVYKSGYYYDIKPDYRQEYNLFIDALKELAKKEKITIETILVSGGKQFPIPYKLDSLSTYAKLCVKATTIISNNSSTYKIKTVKEKQEEETITKLKEIQKQNEEGWATFWKCILVVGIIILAFIICLNADIGKLGMALLLIGSVILGYVILCKTNKK